MEVFGFEKSFFKSVLVRFNTNFFEAEHLISLDSFERFFSEIKNHIQDALHHLHDLMIELDLIDSGMDFTNTKEDIDYLLSESLGRNFCLNDK